MLKIKKLFLLFFFSFLSLFFSLFSYYRPEISISDWRNRLYGSIYPMVTLDGNLSNPLDQKLHDLLGHLQYISPTTTIIYTTQSLHNHYILHKTYTNNPYSPSHGLMQVHAVYFSGFLKIWTNLVCMWLCMITWSLIWAILVDFPSMTSLFDRLCRHMTWWLCSLVLYLVVLLCSMAFPGQHKSLILAKFPQCCAVRPAKIPHFSCTL